MSHHMDPFLPTARLKHFPDDGVVENSARHKNSHLKTKLQRAVRMELIFFSSETANHFHLDKLREKKILFFLLSYFFLKSFSLAIDAAAVIKTLVIT